MHDTAERSIPLSHCLESHPVEEGEAGVRRAKARPWRAFGTATLRGNDEQVECVGSARRRTGTRFGIALACNRLGEEAAAALVYMQRVKAV